MADYPERRPDVTRFETFTASFAVAAEARGALEDHLHTLETEIDAIVARTIIHGGPVLQPLLALTHDRAELEALADALRQVAPVVEAHDRCTQRLAVFQVAESDPEWLVAAFGDFDEHLREFGALDEQTTPFVPAPVKRRKNRMEL